MAPVIVSFAGSVLPAPVVVVVSALLPQRVRALLVAPVHTFAQLEKAQPQTVPAKRDPQLGRLAVAVLHKPLRALVAQRLVHVRLGYPVLVPVPQLLLPLLRVALVVIVGPN